MDRSFDLLALLKQRQQPTAKSHKSRPTQFESVAGGVQKRLETNIKYRKSSRSSVFDRIRNIATCESPKALALSDTQQKVLYRKQQLEKWKEEKEKKKKEAAALKKKPFLVGVSQRKSFGPPPPAGPSRSTSRHTPSTSGTTSGRVTRSQARQKIETKTLNTHTQSFAPSNASFKPPQFLNTKVPTLAPVNKKKPNKPKQSLAITFEPVLPQTSQKVEPRNTRARSAATKPKAVDSKTRKPNEKAKAKVFCFPSEKPSLSKILMIQGSSQSSLSSDTEQKKTNFTRSHPQKSIPKAQSRAPSKHALLSSSSSDMEEKKTFSRSKPSQQKPTKAQESAPMLQDSSSSQDSGSMSTQDSVSMPVLDNIPLLSQDESPSTPEEKVPKSESSSEEKLRLSKPIKLTLPQIVQIIVEANNTSPCVVPGGKDNAESGSTPKPIIQIKEKAKDISPSATTFIDTDDSAITLTLKQRTGKDNAIELTPEQAIRIIQEAEKISPCATTSRSTDYAAIVLTPEQEKIIEEAATHISPCVTTSRGKDNARREMKQKLDDGLLDEDNSNMDRVNHFRRQLESETARMTALCDTWDQVSAQTVLPEPVLELVLTAVGQARLLMSQKLRQFAALVEDCARPAAAARLVTPADLLGFWDMVFMQIENVDMRFKRLDELRLANWVEEQEPAAKKVARPPAKRPVARAQPSRLREMIAAVRKAKKNKESKSDTSGSANSGATNSPAEVKTFDAGFFSISSPLKRASMTASTPANKSSLLKSVLSSEAKKSVSKNSASFAMLRASWKSKNVEIDGVSPLAQTPSMAPVNLYATPARSILKQNNPDTGKKTDKVKTVLFQESDGDVLSSPVSYVSCSKSPESSTGLAPLVEDKENKNTPKRRSRLVREDAEPPRSPVLTRGRRKSAQTPLAHTNINVEAETKKRSTRKTKEPQEEVTPKRSTRLRKSAAAF